MWLGWNTSYHSIRPKKIILLFPEMRVMKKSWPVRSQVTHRMHCNASYANSTFLYWKTRSSIFKFLKGKKCKFVRIILLLEIFLFVCVFFWNKKYIFSYTFDFCGRVRNFHPADFWKQDYIFWSKVLYQTHSFSFMTLP